MNKDRVSGFAPLVGKAPKVLVLGSMPGVASLEAGEYYAHGRNAFWPIMGELFRAGPELPYEERVRALTSAGLAVWDVLACCVRPGSADTAIDIASARPNGFAAFYRRHRSVRRVFFNGAAAAGLYRRLVLPQVQTIAPYIVHERLPSTSPAYAAMSRAEKLRHWTAVRDVLL